MVVKPKIVLTNFQKSLLIVKGDEVHGATCSVTKSCLTLFEPMDCSMPGSSVLPYLLEFAQIHVLLVGDAI